MSPYFVLPLLIIIALIQTTLLPILLPGPVRPDLMLMVVVGWGVVHGSGEAALWGLAGGLLLDLFSGAPFGLHTFALGGIGWLADTLQTNFFRSNLLIPLATIFIATLLYHIGQAAVMQLLGYAINWAFYSFNVVLPTAILNTALMPIVYFILRRLDRVVRPRLTW
ncbi:MAG: rod shape-determining protein MreD [Anaerolineae bacterium]|nr:rod shape-determining protein MreD [Anaerolineae bacterium]